MSQTLFQKYGGFAAVSRIVMTFYDKALDSDQIGDYFEGVEMARLVDHQTKFIASLLGGPAAYTDRQLGQLHHHLAISQADFARWALCWPRRCASMGWRRATSSRWRPRSRRGAP
ncbi:MAG: group 1 truncated hemoglobin [Pseudomonadota bacterium]